MKIVSFFLLLLPLLCFSQKGFKPGKIDMSAMQANCPYDSSAGAFYIWEYGQSALNHQLELELRHVVQIKIVDKSEFNLADITIPYWIKRSVQNLKAYTYNIENGKLVTTELEKKDILKEKVDDDMMNLKFSMPNVKEGSVIEYSYRANYGNITSLNTWYFQRTIPVLKSEYHIRIPEYFDYHKRMTGYVVLDAADMEMENGRFGSELIRNRHHYYRAINVPAFDDESYIRSESDVISKINFELRSFNIPGVVSENYLFRSYAGLANKMMEDEFWSRQIAKASWAEGVLARLMTENDSVENAKKIFNYIKNFEKSDEPALSLRQCFKDKKGTDTDLNRTLIAVLREAGFSVFPVRIRTRKSGRLDQFNPMYRNFNFTIVKLQIGEETYLLDASEKEHVFGILPRYCLNGKGLVIKKGPGEWVDLKPYKSNGTIVQTKMELTDDGLLSGKLVVRRKGYAAWAFDQDIEEDGNDDYMEEFEKGKENWIIDSHEIDDLDDEYSNEESFEVEIEGQVEDLGDLIYLNPVVYSPWDENPFKQTERIYPIDFGVPISETAVIEITLPDGVEVESLPENAALVLPERGASLSYSATSLGNRIMINQRIAITKLEYLPDEYPLLREFFARIIEKGGEQIVLKRL